MSRAIKRLGANTCDSCGREFVVRPKRSTRPSDIHWVCPHCGFNNKVGEEWHKNAQRKATEASARTRRANA